MSIWERIQNVDRRYLYVMLLIVVCWPIVQPWGLPLRISKETRDFFQAVENVPEGGVVALCITYRTESIAELNPMTAALFKHAMSRGIKLIMWAAADEGANVVQNLLVPIAEKEGYQYGVDWINLGYKPGGDVTLKKMVDDFWDGAGNCDFYGKSLDEYPIMKGFTSLGQADLLVDICGIVPGPQRFLTMVTIPTGIPMVVGVTSVDVPSQMNYYMGGQYRGLLAGLTGAAEYELLTFPGTAVSSMDAQSAAHMLIIVAIILGNISYFLSRKTVKAVRGGMAK